MMRISKLAMSELRLSVRRGYATPRCNRQTGVMLSSQWRAWKRLESLGLAYIEGCGEAEDIVPTDAGMKAADAAGKE